MIVYANAQILYIYYDYIVIMYIYTQSYQNTAAHVGTKPFSNLEKQCWTTMTILERRSFYQTKAFTTVGCDKSKERQ